MFDTYSFYKSQKLETQNFKNMDQIWKRRAPGNDEDPFEKKYFLKIWVAINLKT